MNIKLYATTALLFTALTTSALAQDVKSTVSTKPVKLTKETQVIKDRVEKMIGPNQVDMVTKSAYSGLYELVTKGGIYYTDKDAKYFIAGPVIDIATKKNLTEDRLSEVNKIDFNTLPLDKSIKYTKGDGSRVIAVFEDPNCGYCKMFRKEIHKLDNVTVYTFQYNILSPDSIIKSKNIWCSSDKIKVWDDWMINNVVPKEAEATCVAPHEAVLALGQKIRITGTPAIFFKDGNRVTGMINSEQLEQKFKELDVKTKK